MSKEFILITNANEAIETQINLFQQGYFWYYDDKDNPELLLKSVKQYPIFIVKKDNNYLNWIPNEYLNKYNYIRKEYRKNKLQRLEKR